MNQLKSKTLLLSIALLIISYALTLFIWLQIKDDYHLFFISQITERIVIWNNLEIFNTSWVSDNYRAKVTFERFIEIIPQERAVELRMPFELKLEDIPSFSTFATPMSLSIAMFYVLYQRSVVGVKVFFEVVVLLFVTHAVIFALMTILKLDTFYIAINAKLAEAGISYIVSSPLSDSIFDTLFYINGFLVKIVVRFEPFLIAIYIFFQHRRKIFIEDSLRASTPRTS